MNINNPIKIVRNYIKVLTDVVIREEKYSYLDADIINRKIVNILFKIPVNENNNFDIVSYTPKEDPVLLDSLFILFELYIKLDIYKTTGVTYSEFKNMTPLEKNIFLEYVNYKNQLSDIDYEAVKEEQDESTKSNLYDF